MSQRSSSGRAEAEHMPRVHQFPIGDPGPLAANAAGIGSPGAGTGTITPVPGIERTTICIVHAERFERGLDIQGMVRNDGDLPFTFSVEESLDNEYPAPGDAYSGINIVVQGSGVANVVVQPRGRVVFQVRREAGDDPFLRFRVGSGEEEDAYGFLTLTHFTGELDRRERAGVP